MIKINGMFPGSEILGIKIIYSYADLNISRDQAKLGYVSNGTICAANAGFLHSAEIFLLIEAFIGDANHFGIYI